MVICIVSTWLGLNYIFIVHIAIGNILSPDLVANMTRNSILDYTKKQCTRAFVAPVWLPLVCCHSLSIRPNTESRFIYVNVIEKQ
jgi:hypothetical protein